MAARLSRRGSLPGRRGRTGPAVAAAPRRPEPRARAARASSPTDEIDALRAARERARGRAARAEGPPRDARWARATPRSSRRSAAPRRPGARRRGRAAASATSGVSAAFAVHATIDALPRAVREHRGPLPPRPRGGPARTCSGGWCGCSEPGLAGGRPAPDGPIVVVAQALGPSDTVALARERRRRPGGRPRRSDEPHRDPRAGASAFRRSSGSGDVARSVSARDAIVVVDGDRGEVDRRPRRRAPRRGAARSTTPGSSREDAWAATRDLPAVTRDGVEIVLRANIEFPDEAAVAMRFGARGIGLYRSEFLFVARAPASRTKRITTAPTATSPSASRRTRSSSARSTWEARSTSTRCSTAPSRTRSWGCAGCGSA